MIRNISVGIDVGSSATRVVVGEFLKGEKNPKIVGIGEAPTLGLRHGYVVNSNLATMSVKNAVSMAEKTVGVKIKRAFISLSGATLRGEMSSGGTIVSKADGEVTNLDVNKALQDCEDNLNLGNKKIIHMYPVSFRLDGKEVLGRLEGMRGTKLEAKALFVTYSVVHLEDLLGAIAEAGIEAVDVIASPIAINNIVLSERQKIVGVALVDIGAETTSLSVFENGMLVSIFSFSIGSSDITNDIALGFKIPLEKAEGLKLGNTGEEFSKKKLDEVIEARLCDIFESIDNHLKKIKRSELLPAGIVFVGGGANIAGLPELSKSILKLPSSLGTTEIFGNVKTKLRDSSWFAALGLLTPGKDTGNYSENSFKNLFRDLKNTIKSSIKQLMP
ncbi:MAG: Cell division protein ftsA [Candidatus Nomurabacteria bacterium GW2011_GWF2_43_8]|uniref:Cell division protein FtsA n=3 Tax=Candidatus Nomuraibacteriota TaxID=1752729 RepID=A0A0G1FQ92_9BACT|nr:MAG: Cell division protein ftsA [Candidatus Nomurabacteria bacterium GW2011_GWA2_43_15]KKT19106.1 MAG: Cell division protein ftsA [Candidatus Nomurabacteria bacterium GW2011_GWB1_43_7]KKT24651.1 MAG: Cell division protein ftsA [Candidatus Nomurabacteria bacterium GW2011_GWF2_43_8]